MPSCMAAVALVTLPSHVASDFVRRIPFLHYVSQGDLPGSWQAQHFGHINVHVIHLDVSCSVAFSNQIVNVV